MSQTILSAEFLSGGTSERRDVILRSAIVAGWTGRDPEAVEKHIRELEELGVARPASVPIYYRVAATRITTAGAIEVSASAASVAVVPPLLSHPLPASPAAAGVSAAGRPTAFPWRGWYRKRRRGRRA